MTPAIRLAMTSTSFGLVGDLDLIKTAELCRTVSMALRPAKTIVWPDSAMVRLASLPSVFPASEEEKEKEEEESETLELTNQIYNTIRCPQCTSCLHAAPQRQDRCLYLSIILLPISPIHPLLAPFQRLQPFKILSRQPNKTRCNPLPHQLSRIRTRLPWHLNL